MKKIFCIILAIGLILTAAAPADAAGENAAHGEENIALDEAPGVNETPAENAGEPPPNQAGKNTVIAAAAVVAGMLGQKLLANKSHKKSNK